MGDLNIFKKSEFTTSESSSRHAARIQGDCVHGISKEHLHDIDPQTFDNVALMMQGYGGLNKKPS